MLRAATAEKSSRSFCLEPQSTKHTKLQSGFGSDSQRFAGRSNMTLSRLQALVSRVVTASRSLGCGVNSWSVQMPRSTLRKVVDEIKSSARQGFLFAKQVESVSALSVRASTWRIDQLVLRRDTNCAQVARFHTHGTHAQVLHRGRH